MIVYNRRINMVPGEVPVFFHLSQYDTDVVLQFELYASEGTFVVEQGTTAMIRGTKPDRNGISLDAEIETEGGITTVTVEVIQQMTAVAGKSLYELSLRYDGEELNTANFILDIERAPLDAETLPSESVIKELVNVTEQADEIIQAAEDILNAIDDTLSQQGKAADAKKVGDEITSVRQDLSEIVPGLSDAAKIALLNCFANVAWKGIDGQNYYDALQSALYEGSIYIGTLTFPLVKESSPFIGGNSYNSSNNIVQRKYSVTLNRIGGDLTNFVFQIGDKIILDDTETYAMAIGTTNATDGNDLWIGGGYLSEYPFIVTSENISFIKKLLIKRNDNLDVTQEDFNYINSHILLERVVNKTLDRITVSYDNETIYLEADNLSYVRPHLTVTAYYTDNTSEIVSLYEIRANITTGANLIAISYGGKTVYTNINAVELDYFLRNINPDNGLPRWGDFGETPENNSGYIVSRADEVDKVGFNISNLSFAVGDILHIPTTYYNVKYAIGTNIPDTSYNNRGWISGGFMANEEYTLLLEDISDMKVFYCRPKDNTSNIQTDSCKVAIRSEVYIEKRG